MTFEKNSLQFFTIRAIIKTQTKTTTTMIIEQAQNNIVTQGVQEAISFGIKSDGLAHIFNVLRNQLYSNKILAILREYSCNAVDAHVEANCEERPIKVSLPSRLMPELKIRDYGLGLSENDIKEIYAFYGESTKRKSNSLIGQLGLGSKSAFAYGDNFVINSFFNGVKITYNAYIDETQVGQIAKLSSCPTDEENGVEIVIPVKQSDFDNFTTTAEELFAHFKVRPIIEGVADFNYPVKNITLSGDNWRMFEKHNLYNYEHHIIMGNIRYRIDKVALKLNEDGSTSFDDEIIDSMLSNCKMEIDIPIGELDIAASRESLQYTNKTIDCIKKSILTIKDELEKRLLLEYKSVDSLWSYKCLMAKMEDFHHPYYTIYNIISKHNNAAFQYDGKVITNSYVDFGSTTDFVLYAPRKKYIQGSRKVQGGKRSEISGNLSPRNVVVVENTKKLKSQIVNYIIPFLEDDKSVILFTPQNNTVRKQQMEAIGIKNKEIIDIASLSKKPLPYSKRMGANQSNTIVKNSKHSSSVFILDRGISLGSYHNTKSDYWNQQSLNLSKLNVEDYAYIEIDRFFGTKESSKEIHPAVLIHVLNDLQTLIDKTNAKNVKVPKLIGLKKSMIDKVKKTKLKTLDTFILDAFKKIEKQSNFSEIIYTYEIHKDATENNRSLFYHKLFKKINENNAPNTLRILTIINELKLSDNHLAVRKSFHNIISSLSINYIRPPKSDKLKEITLQVDKLGQTMPLVQYVHASLLSYSQCESNQAIAASMDYIQTRDFMLNNA